MLFNKIKSRGREQENINTLVFNYICEPLPRTMPPERVFTKTNQSTNKINQLNKTNDTNTHEGKKIIQIKKK